MMKQTFTPFINHCHHFSGHTVNLNLSCFATVAAFWALLILNVHEANWVRLVQSCLIGWEAEKRFLFNASLLLSGKKMFS